MKVGNTRDTVPQIHHVCDSVKSREWSCTRFKSGEQSLAEILYTWVKPGQASTLSRLLGLWELCCC